MSQNAAIRTFIENEYGSTDGLIKEILGDFFRHGFDGSGADNFFDAGSCIDGRLTSAWNWCSTLEKKRFFHVFLLTGKIISLPIRLWGLCSDALLLLGFVGFDGQW